MSKFRNIKVRVGDPETSRKVQEKLFEDGCEWLGKTEQKPERVQALFLFVDNAGRIGWDNDCGYFDEDNRKELTPAEILGDDVDWNGTGLPPVGSTVEAKIFDYWFVVTIVAYDDGCVFGQSESGPVAFREGGLEFRPIRTEEEKRREADIEELAKLLTSNVGIISLKKAAELVIDAGFTRGGDKKKAP